jgi:outer membrane receptor protein involved in Fe transport
MVDALKLRAAWGKSGRAPGAFDAVKVYEATQADELVPGLVIDNLGNAELGPEISQELEGGFELSMFDSRLSADFTYYKQKTLDALVGVPPAPSFGTTQRTLENLGETKNSGLESVLTIVPVRTDNLEWAINAGYSTNNSEIVSLGPLESRRFNLRVGFPIGVEYDDVVSNVGAVGVAPEYTTEVLGTTFPTKLGSLGTRFTFNQSLTFDILAESQKGHVRPAGIGWATARRLTWPACFGIQNEFNANGYTNLTAQQSGTCNGTDIAWGMWTTKADFIKIRSASLSYRLPEDLVPGTRSVTLMLQGKNLARWTDYTGLDPESTDRGLDGGDYQDEYYNMTAPRVLIFNVTVNF